MTSQVPVRGPVSAPVRAIVFDIGRVLVGWDPEGAFARWLGAERAERLFAEVALHQMNLRVDRGAPFAAEVEALAAAHPDWAPEIRLWHERWSEMFAPPIDGTVRLLERLRAGPLPVHALTNFGVDTFEIARRQYPFLQGFTRTFVSGHLGVLKPEPGIYAAVEAATGLSGAEIFFTDDSPANVEAAAARGWRAHLFEGPEGLEARLAAEGLLEPERAA